MTLASCTQSSDTSLLLPLVPDLSSFLLLHFLQELQGGRVLWFHFQQSVQIVHAGSDVLQRRRQKVSEIKNETMLTRSEKLKVKTPQ